MLRPKVGSQKRSVTWCHVTCMVIWINYPGAPAIIHRVDVTHAITFSSDGVLGTWPRAHLHSGSAPGVQNGRTWIGTRTCRARSLLRVADWVAADSTKANFSLPHFEIRGWRGLLDVLRFLKTQFLATAESSWLTSSTPLKEPDALVTGGLSRFFGVGFRRISHVFHGLRQADKKPMWQSLCPRELWQEAWGAESMRLMNSTVCKEHDAGLTRNLSTAFKVKLKRLRCRRFCVTWQWMSLEPVQSNPCALESKGNRGWIFTLTLCGVAACASSGARISILQTKGQACVFANRTLPAFALEFTGNRAESMPCDRRIPQSAKNTMPVWREISQQLSRSSWRDFDVAGFVSLGSECLWSWFRAISVKLKAKATEAGYSH